MSTKQVMSFALYSLYYDSSILVSLWRDSATRYFPVMSQITYRTHTIAQPEFNADGQLLARPNLA